MVSYSKYFYEATKGLTCHELVHPNILKCPDYGIDIFSETIFGCMKFVFPFCIVSGGSRQAALDKN